MSDVENVTSILDGMWWGRGIGHLHSQASGNLLSAPTSHPFWLFKASGPKKGDSSPGRLMIGPHVGTIPALLAPNKLGRLFSLDRQLDCARSQEPVLTV